MKKINRLFTGAIALAMICSTARAQDVAWMGYNSSDWNDPGNWSWFDGSYGIPGATDDILIDYDNVWSYLVLESGDSVSCHNITFNDYSGSGVYILLSDDALLSIYGSAIASDVSGYPGYIYSVDMTTGAITNGGRVKFMDGSKTVNNTLILVGTVEVYSDDINLMDNAYMYILDSLKFKKPPVNTGLPATGNIIINNGFITVPPTGNISVPSYSDNQIPPHIITTSTNLDLNESLGGLYAIDNLNETAPGLSGTGVFPVGPSAMSYTPVSVTNSGGYIWGISVVLGLPTSCPGNPVNNNDAVQYNYLVSPAQIDMNGQLVFLTSLTSPANISLTFNQANTGQDVLSDFNPDEYNINMFSVNANGCYEEIPGAIQSDMSTNYITVSSPAQSNFGHFIMAPFGQSSVTIDVTTSGGVPAEINTPAGTLQMTADVLPAGVSQEVNWSIVPETGGATISSTGLVTASANGTVWAKGISVANPDASDSVLVTISNQDMGIHGIPASLGFMMYPNPAGDVLYLTMKKQHAGLSVSVTDAFGREISNTAFPANALNTPRAISLSHLSSGLYFLHVKGTAIDFYSKFIKQ